MKHSTTPNTKKKTTGRKKKDLSLAHVRSAVTNGSCILPDVDHRSHWMRRLRDITVGHIQDLGGEGNVSNAELVLIRRAAMLTLQIEMMEKLWAANDGEASPAQLRRYERATNCLRRVIQTLGLQRRARDITPPTSHEIEAYAEELLERGFS